MNIIQRTNTTAKNIAFMYHDNDKAWKESLCDHLTLMRRQGLISIVEASTADSMPHLDIILLLMSPSLLGSDKMLNAIDYALAHRTENQRIVPIKIRACNLKGHRLEKLRDLPRSGKALNEWKSKDEGLALVAEEIRQIVENRG